MTTTFKADTCPAPTAACRSNTYLVTGDLVLVGQTRGGVHLHQLPDAPEGQEATPPGPRRLAAERGTDAGLRRRRQPSTSDWLGSWDQRYAGIEIKPGGASAGRLRIEGIAAYPTARDYHTPARSMRR